MLNRLRDQVGTAGLVVAIVALVAALGGGAYAASKGLNSTQKKEVKKIAKSFQGTGPAGAAGPAGPAGAKGDAGAPGAPGKDGVSATTATFSGTKGSCKAGGVTVKSASPEVNVCNGEDGEDGETGFTEALPEGMTETGSWVISELGKEAVPASNRVETALSFPIPLENEVPASNVHFEPAGGYQGTEAVHCPGSAADPEAEAGHMCVYLAFAETFGKGADAEWESLGNESVIKVNNAQGTQGASRSGAVLLLFIAAETRRSGTWAVTAP